MNDPETLETILFSRIIGPRLAAAREAAKLAEAKLEQWQNVRRLLDTALNEEDIVALRKALVALEERR